MPNGDATMETNKSLQFNLGTFNVPTIVGIVALGAMIYNSGRVQERQDARIDAIEINRAARSAEINKILDSLSTRVVPIDNMTYRLTIAEQGIADTNRRIDRQGDSMQAIRNDISNLSTSIEVLKQTLESRLPLTNPGIRQ